MPCASAAPMAAFTMALPASASARRSPATALPCSETFVFDFSGDLYGEVCSVSFFGHLRDELKFDGLDPLVVQMKKDDAEARALLSGVRPLSMIDRKIAFAADANS